MSTNRNASPPTVRAPRDGEEHAILEVLRAAFGPDWPNLEIEADAMDHLLWKMECPTTTRDQQRVIEFDGRLVGFNATIARDAALHGRRVRALGGGDSCVDPLFQGRGLFRALWDYTMTQIAPEFDVMIGDTSNESVQHIWVADGLGTLATPLDLLFKPLSRWRLAAAQGRQQSRSLVPLRVARMSARELISRVVSRRKTSTPEDLTLRVVERFDQRADELAILSNEEFEFICLRDRDYLNWRYCDPRGGGFRVVIAEVGERLLGYATTRELNGAGWLADLLVRPGMLGVADRLISDVVEYYSTTSVHSIATRLPRPHPYGPLLRARGFIRTAGRPHQFHTPNGNPDVVATASAPDAVIHLMPGDSDEI